MAGFGHTFQPCWLQHNSRYFIFCRWFVKTGKNNSCWMAVKYYKSFIIYLSAGDKVYREGRVAQFSFSKRLPATVRAHNEEQQVWDNPWHGCEVCRPDGPQPVTQHQVWLDQHFLCLSPGRGRSGLWSLVILYCVIFLTWVHADFCMQSGWKYCRAGLSNYGENSDRALWESFSCDGGFFSGEYWVVQKCYFLYQREFEFSGQYKVPFGVCL